MWLLKDKDGKLRYLMLNRTFTIGRKKGSLVLSDTSISRHHAEITVVPRNDIGKIGNNMEPVSNCIIKDTDSKYGNYILQEGNVEIQVAKDGYTFKHMDQVRFGVQESIYTVMYVPMIIATSGLNEIEKKKLPLIADEIDAKITPGWEPICTHMTVSNPIMSEKLTCAIAYGTPIVPMEYWNFVVKAFEANEEMPNPADFVGLIHQKMAMLGKISILPNPLRRTLFKDLTFVHFDSQKYRLYERMIAIAGGKSILYRNETHRNLDVCNDNVIVVQLVDSNTTQATGTEDAKYAAVCEKLGKVHRRTIPTAEIALAIYHVSTKTYCNPKHDHAQIFKARKSDNSPENSSILALDTQEVELPSTTSVRGRLESHTTNMEAKNSDKPPVQDHYIKESTEESINPDSQSSEIVRPKSSNILASKPSSSLSQPGKSTQRKVSFSTRDSQSQLMDSMKIASLNYEKYLEQDFNAKASLNENSVKRNREEDEKIDTTNKKICRDVLTDERRNKKLNVNEKEANLSYKDMMPDNQDVIFLDEKDPMEDLFKINRGKTVSKNSQKMGDNESLRKNTVSKPDAQDNIASKTTSYSDSAGKSETSGKFELEDRTSLKNQTEEETSRKRKICETEDSRWKIDSPLKRNKVTADEVKKRELTPTDFASSNKTAHVKTEWNPAKKSPQHLEDSWFATTININTNGRDKSSVNRGSNKTELLKKPGDPDSSLQPLLRVKSCDEVTILTTRKYGKKFHKTYKFIPHRIKKDDMVDMYSWEELNTVPKERISSDEEAVTPQKVSPRTSKKKKFRV